MSQYWVTAQQLATIIKHLKKWNNSIISTEFAPDEEILLTLQNPISDEEIVCFGVIPI